MARQSKAQKDTVGRVMHEFKAWRTQDQGRPEGPESQAGDRHRPAEAGASNQESPKKNRDNLRKTKAKERKGRTGQARAEGAATRAQLYEEAKRREIPGRSKMSKAQLERALRK